MNYYNKIKNTLIDVEVYKKVKDYSKNKYELTKYYEVGKLLVLAQGGEKRAKYGNELIKKYSKKLSQELGKGYSERSLKYMRQFYIYQKGQALPAQLSWSHYIELFKIKNQNEINYYINLTVRENLSYRNLHERIKNKEYQRLGSNLKQTLIIGNETNIGDNLKHPILIRNKYNLEILSEKVLKQLILEDIFNFMMELGTGFSLIDSEYKIKLGDRYNYIDLLLFNIEFNCYVVIELKVTELKKEQIGQIKLYMNYIDKNIKKIYHDSTIGIIIAKRDNKYVMEYCSDPRIYETTYKLL